MAHSPTSAVPGTPSRLTGLDALRGFDMFWILGADAFVTALNKLSHSRATGFLAAQLDHADLRGTKGLPEEFFKDEDDDL